MGTYGDERRGGDRWRDRDSGYRGQGDYRGRGSFEDDRGFFDRAGDEVRSWFGDEEAQRRREADERRWEREQRMAGYGAGGYERHRGERHHGETAGHGWGNQSGESWHRDRPGRSGWGDERPREESGGARWSESDEQSQAGARDLYGYDRVPGGTSGFGGAPYAGRRFDRIDPGMVGTHGAHPMSVPAGGAYDVDFGARPTSFGSSERYSSYRERMLAGPPRGHDPHYEEWRRRQIEGLDRDYDEYRREHQSRFEQEFGSWRSKREGQRRSLERVSEHMEVVGSDGAHVGKVDCVRGDRIVLAKSDEAAGGIHHSVPCSWIERVEDKVVLEKKAEDAKLAWREEEGNRALFEPDQPGRERSRSLQGSDGD
jgi:hypothetical protein